MAEVKTIINGTIKGPRLGMKNVKKYQYLASFEGVNCREEATRTLLGKKVICIGKKGKVFGRIVGLHGKNGVVRARFRRGLPEPSNGLPVRAF
ncbi:MAG: 50S ribosomal protein L35ae [Thermoproteota archaeon]